MKNIQTVYMHIFGRVYAKYEVSTCSSSVEQDGKPLHSLEVLSVDQMKELASEHYFCYPLQGRESIIVDETGKEEKQGERLFYDSGRLTVDGVINAVKRISTCLESAAEKVWEGVDPRCSAKIPSRLYRNVANICADALNLVGITATVKLYPLNPAMHHGLRNQYRVTVSTAVPKFPWKKEITSQSENGKQKTLRVVPEFETLHFDFDVTNQMRVEWCWPYKGHVFCDDARELNEEGRPVRWIGNVGGLKARKTRISVDKAAEYVDMFNYLMTQTSLISLLGVDGRPFTPEAVGQLLEELLSKDSNIQVIRSWVS